MAAASHHIAHSPLCQKAARSCKWPFQSARQLEHGAKVTQAVGGAQGETGGARERGHEMSSCNFQLLFPHRHHPLLKRFQMVLCRYSLILTQTAKPAEIKNFILPFVHVHTERVLCKVQEPNMWKSKNEYKCYKKKKGVGGML